MTEKNNNPDEVSFLELLRFLWSVKVKIIKVTSAFLVLGIVIVLLSPKEWQANLKLVIKAPDSGAARGLNGALGKLAGLTGLSLGSSGGEFISPMAYNDILMNDEQILNLLDHKFYSDNLQDSVKLREYLEDHMKLGPTGYIKYVPKALIKLVRGKKEATAMQEATNRVGSDILSLTSNDVSLINKVKSRTSTYFDVEKMTFELGFSMQDPRIAAQVTNYLSEYLETYISDFLSLSQRDRLQFIQKQLALREAEFLEAQTKLASFLDENIDISTNRAKSEEEKLRTDYNLAYSLYSSMQQSHEEAKITLAERNKLFRPISRVSIPVLPSEPRMLTTVMGALLLGLLFSSSYFLLTGFVGKK